MPEAEPAFQDLITNPSASPEPPSPLRPGAQSSTFPSPASFLDPPHLSMQTPHRPSQGGPLFGLRRVPPLGIPDSRLARPAPPTRTPVRSQAPSLPCNLSPSELARGPAVPLPSAPPHPRPPPCSWPVRRRPGSPPVEGGRPSPGTGGGRRAVRLSPERPQPRPRIPAVAGPSGGAAQAHGPDLSACPPAGALPSLPAARRVTAAAPPPSWAWQALPNPAGSGQPRPQRGRAAPAFLPQGSRGRGSSSNAGAFYSLCALRDPQSTLGFNLHPSPILLRAREIWQGPTPVLPSPSNLRARAGEMPDVQSLARSWSLTCLYLWGWGSSAQASRVTQLHTHAEAGSHSES